MCQVDGHRHERARFVASIAEHHALVARAHFVDVVHAFAALSLVGLIDAHGDVGRLLVDGIDNAARVAVKAVLRAVVADLADGIAHDLLHVNVCFRANFARHHHKTRGSHGLACATHVVHVGRNARRRNVAGFLKLDFLCQNGIQDSIRNLIANLVRMTFSHRLRREKIR